MHVRHLLVFADYAFQDNIVQPPPGCNELFLTIQRKVPSELVVDTLYAQCASSPELRTFSLLVHSRSVTWSYEDALGLVREALRRARREGDCTVSLIRYDLAPRE